MARLTVPIFHSCNRNRAWPFRRQAQPRQAGSPVIAIAGEPKARNRNVDGPIAFDSADLSRRSEDLPFSLATGSCFPKTKAAEKSVFVFTALNSIGQLIEAVNVAAAKRDVIRNERFL